MSAVSRCLNGLGWIALMRGNLRQAAVLLDESLAVAQESVSYMVLSLCLDACAAAAAVIGHPVRTVRLLARVEPLQGITLPRPPVYYAERARLLAEVRERPGEAAFAAEWAAGQALTPEAALAEARAALAATDEG